MTFELLPNELLIECFKYFNAPDLFYSFDQLNCRFYHLIRCIPLHLDCQNVRKTIFDQFSMNLLSTPEVKRQIYSINLSNTNTCILIRTFLLYFSLDEFTHLQSLTLTNIKDNNIEQLKSMLPFLLELTCFRLINFEYTEEEILPIVPISKLRTLLIPTLNFILISTDEIFSIINLTISYCSLEDMYLLFRYIPMLQYLNVQNMNTYHTLPYKDNDFINNNDLYSLKRLKINSFNEDFIDLIKFLKQTPDLVSLIIETDNKQDIIDAYQWEQLIISSLPQLTIFKFRFNIHFEDNILSKFKQFQTNFWLKQHHWYTEYILHENSAQIYTIPYISDTYKLTPYINRYPNESIKNINKFNNVSELTFHLQKLPLNESYYFANIRSLSLENQLYTKDIDDDILKIEQIEYLKLILNLSNIKHLIISSKCEIESSFVLLELLKQTINLSSISIELEYLQSFFDDEDLCKYLNKMIIKLDIYQYPYKWFHYAAKRK